MDKETTEKVNEILEACSRQELSANQKNERRNLTQEEIESVVDGAPDTITINGKSYTRALFNETLKRTQQALGEDIAFSLLIDALHSMNCYPYNDRYILNLYRKHGPGEAFWEEMDEHLSEV